MTADTETQFEVTVMSMPSTFPEPRLPWTLVVKVLALLAFLNVSSGVQCEDWSPRRMLVGPYGLPDEEFLAFAERIRPELIVMGGFGPPQWAAQENPRQWLMEWRRVCERLHRSGIKVVGIMELLNAADTPQQLQRFTDFYERDWPVDLLGERPSIKAAELLEQRAEPIAEQKGYLAPRGCAVNPQWRALQKALLKPLVETGLDGFITHRNMFGTCSCPFCHADLDKPHHAPHATPQEGLDTACSHCRQGFRGWLAKRYDAKQLRERFGIDHLPSHEFAPVTGHHREHTRLPSPLELEMLTYSKHAVKDAFDDIFVRYGRTLNPDLVAAQWNHMPYFDELHLDRNHIPPSERTTFAHASADERWGLPMTLWGKDESLFWYCNWGTTQNTRLDQRHAGDVTLYARLLRSFARGRPYVVNKYDFYRPRNMLAEAAALGMLGGAIEVPHRSEEDRAVMARYFDFFARHAAIYAASNGESVADVLLVYPRKATLRGDADGLERVEIAGRTMIVDHVAFDLVPDDLLPTVALEAYRTLVFVEPTELHSRSLAAFQQKQGRILALADRDQDNSLWPREWQAEVISGLAAHSGGTSAAAPFRDLLQKALGEQRVTVSAPWTVESHVYRQPGRLIVHLVNYDHDEKGTGKSSVAKEAPRGAPSVTLRISLRRGEHVRAASFLDPDGDHPSSLEFQQQGSMLSAQTPLFLVYGIAVFEVEREAVP